MNYGDDNIDFQVKLDTTKNICEYYLSDDSDDSDSG